MSSISDQSTEYSDSFFRSLLETAPDAMIIVDKNGRIVIVNSQAENMFGYLREDLFGEAVEILLPEGMRHAHARHRAGYEADPHVRPMGRGLELVGRRKDGSEFPTEISLSPLSTDSCRYVSTVIRDVTKRKQMEREIIEARQKAERANKANTAFLTAASHDLRQPVQALSLLNGALRRTLTDPIALEMVESQQQSLDAMTNLLNSLLDISRLDAGAVEPEIEVFPIQRLIDRLSAEFSRQAGRRGLTYSAVPSAMLVESDPNLLGEIIQNFVSNAIRYTHEGEVTLQCEEAEDHACIRISDTGIGIDPNDLQDIFAEFHQIKTAGQKSEGFGLGLAIVQRLSDLLGHSIEVVSTPGEGSEFSICVPIVGVDDQRDRKLGKSSVRDTDRSKSGTIVLIEDDAAVANALALLMEAEGYRVAAASSAEEALANSEYLMTAPDLIISDFHLLDGSTGLDAVARIRSAFTASIPAFIVTGDTSIVADAARGLRNSLLIRKPVNPDQLLRDIGVAVETGDVPVAAAAARNRNS